MREEMVITVLYCHGWKPESGLVAISCLEYGRHIGWSMIGYIFVMMRRFRQEEKGDDYVDRFGKK